MTSRVVGSDLLIIGTIIAIILVLQYLGIEIDIFRRDHMVVSSVDHEEYSVREDYKNKQRAADILAEINQMYVRIIYHLKKTQMGSPWAANIVYLGENYNPTVLGEHIPTNLNYTSYVAQKGKKIRLCLRTPENRNVFHDMNTIKFVALHELSHMMVEPYGHEEQFWDAFRFILAEAAALGEIKIIDYSKNPIRYCGIPVNSNPIFTGR
jgi:hypothetical protein